MVYIIHQKDKIILNWYNKKDEIKHVINVLYKNYE